MSNSASATASATAPIPDELTMIRRHRLRNLIARALVPLVAVSSTIPAFAAEPARPWPQGTVRVIAPFAPGSTPDLLARLVADRLSKNTGQSFFVEDRPGAGGMIGTAQIARAAPDGATIGVSIGGPLVNNTLLYKSMTYDPFRDLAPITRAVDQPCILVGSRSLAANDVPTLLADLKAAPDRSNYASLGNGTVSHLVMVMIATRAHADPVQVPYAGSGQAVAAMIGGETSLACLPPASVLPQVRAGNLKVLGVAASRRSPLFADLPTLAEQGLPGVEANAWIGFVAPARTPPATIARMQVEIAKVLNDPDVVKTLHAQYMEPVGDTPAAFAAYLRDELDRWRPIIRDNHITLD